MKKKILSLCCCFLGFGTAAVLGQQGLLTAGGNAGGPGGAASYSIGQIFYSAVSGPTNSIIQGIQQPFEVSKVAVNEKTPLNIQASIFPNPTSDHFTIKVESDKLKVFSYELYNGQGQRLYAGKINSDETLINIETLAPTFYYLRLHDESQTVQTFKILKYN